MRTRTLKLTVLLLVAAAVPARAIDLSGRASVGYSKLDAWPTTGEHTTSPHLDLDIGLGAKGVIDRPGFVDWFLSGGYRRVTDEVDGARTGQSSLFLYDARAILFGDRRQPVTLEAKASRNQVEFLTDPQANVFGKAIVDTYGGGLTLNLPERPQLTAGYARTQGTDQVAGLTTHTYAVDEISATAGHGTGDYKFIGTYDGRLGTGAWTSDNVDTHNGTASVSLALPAGLTAQVSDTYQLRIPRASGVGAYRQENNGFSFYLSNSQPIGAQQAVRYSYLHGLTETSPTAFGELMRQSLRYDGDYSLDGQPLLRRPGEPPTEGSRLFGHLRLDAGQNRASTAVTTSDSYGETLGGSLYWRYGSGRTFYELHGGPSVALLQSDGAASRTGYGASAGGRIARDWLGQRLAVNYDADYGLRLYAAEGWTLRQILTGSVSGALGDSHYVASLNAQAWRTSDPTLGEGAGRVLEARFVDTQRRLELEAYARLTDGIAGSTPKEFVSDGLIIPAPFDSHTRELRARVAYNVFTTLGVGAIVALVSNEIPGSPTVNQTEVAGSLEYRFAAFALRMEDRMVWYDQGTGGRNNVFFVSVNRRFGLSF